MKIGHLEISEHLEAEVLPEGVSFMENRLGTYIYLRQGNKIVFAKFKKDGMETNEWMQLEEKKEA